jgi:hypothetical protein
MPIDVREETGDLMHLTVTVRFGTPDRAALVCFVTKAVERHGHVRLLGPLDGFDGWIRDDDWSDAALRIADDRTAVKAGSVGDARRRDDVVPFASEPFRTTPMESFTTEAGARVRLEV